MESNPILTALSKLEQLVNIRFNAINEKFLVVFASLDAVDVKLQNYGDKFQHVNTKVDEITSKITVLDAEHLKLDNFGDKLQSR
jgi:hypothetical protein